jgi:hypothetical protein
MITRSLLLASLVSLAAVTNAQTITTQMTGVNNLIPFDGAQTVYFDITVTAPGGLFVSQMDTTAFASAPGTFEVYRTASGFASATNRTNPSAWRKVATCSGVSGANPMVCVFNSPFHLAAGSYGMALHYIGMQPLYFNPGAGVTLFTNPDVSINAATGVAQLSQAGNPFVGGVSAAPRIANVIMYYSLTGHASDFTLTPLSGAHPMSVHAPGPVLVQFTDQSVTSDPGGISAWQWDYDGVAGVDSILPNPSFNYTVCGDYNVSLTTTDAIGNVATTRNAIVRVDPLTATFTVAKIGDPAIFQFTDTSAGATGWAWNLDGIPGTDSTLQNPTFSYAPNCTAQSVTLATTNACRAAQGSGSFIPTPRIETLFNANNAGGANGMVYFEVVVANPDGISICSLGTNFNGAAGTAVGVTIYTKSGTHVGFTTTAAAWTLRGSTPGVCAGFNVPTTLTLATPIYLPAGTNAMAIQATGLGHAYSGIGANPAPAVLTYGNSDITLNLGIASNAAFGTVLQPRIWNGRLNYRTAGQGLGAYYKFASGCAGTLGVPGNVGVAPPLLGQNMSVNFTNVPAAGIPFYGFSNTLFQGVTPLPIDLAPLGGPGCPVLIDTAFNAGFALSAGNILNWTVPIPNDGAFLGVHFFTQAFSFDAVNALGGVTSDGATALIGNT